MWKSRLSGSEVVLKMALGQMSVRNGPDVGGATAPQVIRASKSNTRKFFKLVQISIPNTDGM